jgi:hypothetical protein
MGLAGFNLRRREQDKKTTEFIDYDNLTLNDLKQIAKNKNMDGYSNMKKDVLIAELKKIETEVEGEK